MVYEGEGGIEGEGDRERYRWEKEIYKGEEDRYWHGTQIDHVQVGRASL